MKKNSKFFLGRFNLSSDEDEYRNHYFKRDKKYFISGVIPFIFVNFFFIRSDYLIFKLTQQFYILLTLRFSFSIISIVFLLIILKTKSYKLNDLILFIWLLILNCLFIYVNYTRPADYFEHYLIDVIYIVVIYVFLQISLEYEIFISLSFTFINLFLLYKIKKFDKRLSYYIVTMSHLFVNSFGVFVSIRLRTIMREQYKLYKHEKTLMNKVKVLKGLLPICYNCHKIRDDKGYWKKLEMYIETYSEAEFTHWLCPDCLEKMEKK